MIICLCECHTNDSILHAIQCCTPCHICGANVSLNDQAYHNREHEMNDPNTYDKIGDRASRATALEGVDDV